MVVQAGWFYQTRYGSVARIENVDNDVNNFFALVVSGRHLDPWDYHLVSLLGFDTDFAKDPRPILILESGSWLHALTAAWKPGDGVLAERLKEAGRRVV